MDQLPVYYFDYLHQGLWHCTSLEGLRAIHQSGEISGSRAELTARYTNSYAYHRRAVSLFDFDRATEEQVYHFPDHPSLLQSFVWQDYDLAPKFPVLTKFLDFWEANLDGKLHSVKMAAQEIVTGNEMRFAAAQLRLH